MKTDNNYEAIIVGGSAAGLSAALILGRSMRKVLVIDSGKPCNRQTPHSHSFMTRDGVTPTELTTIARDQALAYPTVGIVDDEVISISREDDDFRVSTANGPAYQARKILLATGVKDLMPDIGGFAECWGRSVLHCPYCHGYEVKNQPMGVMINGDHADEYAGLIRHWSKDIRLFTNGPAIFSDAQRKTLSRLNIPVIETPIGRLDHREGMLTAVVLQDGNRVEMTALFAPVPTRLHSDLAPSSGCDLTAAGLIAVSPFGETSVPGVFAAGDNSSFMRQVVTASAAGNTAGAWLNKELVSEEIVRLKFQYPS